jgi:hypothetical protein
MARICWLELRRWESSLGDLTRFAPWYCLRRPRLRPGTVCRLLSKMAVSRFAMWPSRCGFQKPKTRHRKEPKVLDQLVPFEAQIDVRPLRASQFLILGAIGNPMRKRGTQQFPRLRIGLPLAGSAHLEKVICPGQTTCVIGQFEEE